MFLLFGPFSHEYLVTNSLNAKLALFSLCFAEVDHFLKIFLRFICLLLTVEGCFFFFLFCLSYLVFSS